MAAVQSEGMETPSPQPSMELQASPSPTPNTSLSDTGVGDMATRATFLSIFIIIGFVGNSVLIATIAQSSRLKGSTINLCIMSLAVANLLDSAGNMPLILGATITEKWDYGSIACHLNAFGLQLVSIVVSLGLMVLTLERFIAVLDPNKLKERLGLRRMGIIIACFWLYSIAFSIPLMINSVVPIKVFPVRYLCTISNNTPLLYLCLTSIFCFLIPVCLCLCFFIYIIKRGVQQSREDRKQRSEPGHTDTTQQPNRLWTEMEGAKFAGVMFVLWLMLQAPYLILSSIMWYRNSTELAGNPQVSDLLYFEYPWELELALTWLKLSYPIFLPSVIFLWKKKVWRKFKDSVLCRKNNLVIDASPNASPEHGNGATDSIPVLFATENGLHIQTYNDEDSGDEDSDSEHHDRENSSSQVIVTKKCDVYGSQFLQLDEEDTSDYDSSGDIDPFSNSNPISVRTEYGRQRSGSSVNTRLSSSMGKIPSSPHHDVSEGKTDIETDEDKIQETRLSTIDETKKQGTQKKQRNRVVSEDKLGMDNPAMVLDDEELAQVTERTSHDSGMGSWEKSKKIKKQRRKKSGSDESQTSKEKPQEAADVIHTKVNTEGTVKHTHLNSGNQKDTHIKDASENNAASKYEDHGVIKEHIKMDPDTQSTKSNDVIQNNTIITRDGDFDNVLKVEENGYVVSVRKKRKKKQPIVVNKDNIDTSETRQNVENENVKPVTKQFPVLTKRQSPDDGIPKQTETRVRPVVPPRKLNSTRHLSDTNRSEEEIPQTKYRRAISAEDRPIPQKRASQMAKNQTKEPDHAVQNDDCYCESETKINDLNKDVHKDINAEKDTGNSLSAPADTVPDKPRVKKKRKKKVVDPELEQKKLAQELDQEMQGVLY